MVARETTETGHPTKTAFNHITDVSGGSFSFAPCAPT